MQLHPARFDGESFTDYQLRRRSENQTVRLYLENRCGKQNSREKSRHDHYFFVGKHAGSKPHNAFWHERRAAAT